MTAQSSTATGTSRPVGRPFQPGQSGNPGGRPKALAEVQALAREHSVAAIETLAKLMENERTPPGTRLAAATALLDRAWGRPHLPDTTEVDEARVREQQAELTEAFKEAVERAYTRKLGMPEALLDL